MVRSQYSKLNLPHTSMAFTPTIPASALLLCRPKDALFMHLPWRVFRPWQVGRLASALLACDSVSCAVLLTRLPTSYTQGTQAISWSRFPRCAHKRHPEGSARDPYQHDRQVMRTSSLPPQWVGPWPKGYSQPMHCAMHLPWQATAWPSPNAYIRENVLYATEANI